MIRAGRLGRTLATTLVAGGLCFGTTGLVPASAAATIDLTVAATTTVNIRSGPGTSYKIIGGLDRGQRITATAKPVKGWVKVRFDKSAAYISARYLNVSGKKLPAAPSRISTTGVKITTDQLNVRSGPGLGSKVVGLLAEGTHLTLSGKLTTGFAQLSYKEHLRWVSVQYLARSAVSPAAPSTSSEAGEIALAFARSQLGKPYRFGATGPKAYDCSGLVLKAWAAAGVTLPRTSYQQFHAGTKITKSQLRPGDLVFFYGPSPSHVGIYSGNGKIIHAPRPGKVVQYIKMSYMPYAGARRPG
jgi:cell wall-associated NlpC family hydrolase